MKKIFPYKYIISFVFFAVIMSCSVEKNTFVNRSYHNLTAHYNVYFNGNEAMKAGLLKIDEQVEEDYTKILPVFKESLPKTEELVSSDMTTAIEKGTKLIKFHSITKPPKKKSGRYNKKNIKSEYNRWVDDAYIMMGRAYLYKKEYLMAISTFQLVLRKYKDDPVRYNAYLWLIRSLGENERYAEAEQLVQTLESDKLFPKKLEGELAIVTADLQLKQQHYEEAIHSLNIGIKKIKGNKRKSRYTFILAQLYQETGKSEQALTAYQQVIRRGPEYPMLFNARIRSAQVASGSSNVAQLRKELNKMRKKKWNQPYLDQIYYALGNISYNEGKVDDAVELYKKSAAVSQNNIHQKALSCITLGNIFFDQRKYIPSGAYYDSAMTIIDNKYPNYEIITDKYNSLSKLVQNLKTVETQDSLQRLAGLPKAELDKLVEKWIADEKKRQEDEMGGDEGGDMMSSYYRANSSRMKLSSSGSSFYFYNTSTISYGKKEFAKLWGNRPDEDNWRRKDKNAVLFDETGEPAEGELAEQVTQEELRADDPTSSEYYTQDIPTTDSMMQASHLKIRDALFDAGTVLKNDFSDFNYSVGCFTSLNNRYPENIYLLTSWFNLWDLYKMLEKPDSANYYKNLIVSQYPESNYAKYLINPNFLIEEAARRDSLNRLYAQAFTDFKSNNFGNAATNSRKVLSMNPDSSMLSKAEFIRTIAESKDFSKNRFADSLRAYIVSYPSAQPVKLAQKILSLIQEDKFSNYSDMVASGYLNDVIKNNELLSKSVSVGDVETEKWDTDNDLLHYFIIAYPSGNQIDINRLKFDLANYNLDHYTSLDFEIETENLNQETSLVIVRNFEDKDAAMVYFMSIIRKPDVFKTLAGKPYLNFIISNNNYRQMLNDRSYDEYVAYFAKNYSTMSEGKFSDKELESPEALMARLKKDPNSELKEQGQYVVVETGGSENAPVAKESIFTLNHDAPHRVVIYIDQPNAGTGFVMRDLIKYNSVYHREKRLRVIPEKIKEYPIFSITQFANAYDANEYLKVLRGKDDIFASLGKTKYDLFIIDDNNLNQLKSTDDIAEWNKFYQINYVRRAPRAPKAEKETAPATEQTGQKTETKAAEPTTVAQPQPVKTETVTLEKERQETAKEVVKEPETAPSPSATKVEEPVKEETKTAEETVPPVAETPAAEASKPAETTEVKTEPENIETTEAVSEKEISEAFVAEPDAPHCLIYLIPLNSPNQNMLVNYLNRLNTIKYPKDKITVEVEQLDDVRMMITVKELPNKDKAKIYMTDTQNDPRVSMALRNVNYKAFLISNNNLQRLRKTKDIAAYQQFYSNNY